MTMFKAVRRAMLNMHSVPNAWYDVVGARIAAEPELNLTAQAEEIGDGDIPLTAEA